MLNVIYTGQKIISDGDEHRYVLVRTWKNPICAPKNRIAWIGMNPAPLTKDGGCRTLTQIESLSRKEGYDSFVMLNLYSKISKTPRELNDAMTVVDARNDDYIRKELGKASRVVCAWGDRCCVKGFSKRVRDILKLLKGRKLYCLEFTAKGNPIHISRVNGEMVLHIWRNVFCAD